MQWHFHPEQKELLRPANKQEIQGIKQSAIIKIHLNIVVLPVLWGDNVSSLCSQLTGHHRDLKDPE